MTAEPHLVRIPLADLEPHPGNANVMPEHLLAKLTEHIRRTDQYPPLIVRSMTSEAGALRYQILDGHHRAIALRRLGRDHARCDVWAVDDQHAAVLLLTLNRLHGEDDPHRRSELLAAVSQTMTVAEIEAMLPDSRERIERLLALTTQPPAALPQESDLPPLPRALTFFLEDAAYRGAIKALDALHSDRSAALLKALNIAVKNNEACAS